MGLFGKVGNVAGEIAVRGFTGGLAGMDDVKKGWGKLEDAYQRNLQAKGYEYDPAAFQDPYRDQNQQMLSERLTGVEGRGMGQAPSDFRGQQQALANQLALQAQGQGPSLAQGQLQQATDRNLAQALAMQATAGGDPAMAQRGLAMQRADLGQQAAMQATQTRMAEQMAAQQQLGGLLGQARGGDLQARQLEQQQQAMNDQMVRYYVQSGLDLDQAQWMANMELERLRGQQHMGIAGANLAANQQLFGGLLSAGASAGSMMAGKPPGV